MSSDYAAISGPSRGKSSWPNVVLQIRCGCGSTLQWISRCALLAQQVPRALLKCSSEAPSISVLPGRCSIKSLIICAASASRVISILRGSGSEVGIVDGLVAGDGFGWST
jgi:hypothetical protein